MSAKAVGGSNFIDGIVNTDKYLKNSIMLPTIEVIRIGFYFSARWRCIH